VVEVVEVVVEVEVACQSRGGGCPERGYDKTSDGWGYNSCYYHPEKKTDLVSSHSILLRHWVSE